MVTVSKRRHLRHGANLPTINWTDIRPLNGNQADGFEELCAQFARAEAPTGSKFVRTGNPDGGVECYAELDGGDEWGWQAKYFLRAPDASQWSQIDKSVRTALRSRPRLARYIVCAPVDLPAGRTGRRKSAIERWNERVQNGRGGRPTGE